MNRASKEAPALIHAIEPNPSSLVFPLSSNDPLRQAMQDDFDLALIIAAFKIDEPAVVQEQYQLNEKAYYVAMRNPLLF
jgi:hypothetical protein